jgi:hypothetical protein
MRKAVAVTVILVIVYLSQLVAVEANPYMFLQFTRIKINSPDYHVYVSPNVDISFDYYVEGNSPQVDSFSYSLDSNPISTLANSKTSVPHINFIEYSVFKTLENLTNDNHKLVVYAYFSNKTVSPILNRTVVVDTTYIQPKPIIISPLNQATYNAEQVSITYAINAKIISSSYTLDTPDYSPKWTDFTGNTTLTNLSEGSHKLRLSLSVQPHSGVPYEHHYPTIYFNVGSERISTLTPTPSPDPKLTPTPSVPETPKTDSLPTTIFAAMNLIVVLAVVAAVATVVAAVLLVYFKKHNKEK